VVVGDVAPGGYVCDHEYQYADPLELRRSLEETWQGDTPRRFIPVVMPYGETYREAQLNPDWFNGYPVTTLLHKIWWEAPAAMAHDPVWGVPFKR